MTILPSLLVRHLFFVLALSLAGVVSAAQELAPDPYFGMHIHRADRGTRWPSVPFGAWRLWDAGVTWPQLEPVRGRWDFSRLDRYVAFSERFGIDVLLPFGLTPQWASARPAEPSAYSPGFAAEPTHLSDWSNYVRVVAERYKGRVRHFEVWNEVNIPAFYSGSVDTLVRLTCEAQRVIKDVSPDNRLVSPSWVGAGKNPGLFGAFLKAGGAKCIDIVGYHFYVPHREPEELADLVGDVKRVMVLHGVGHLPLWNTEGGWWIERGDGKPEPEADKRWRRVTLAESASVVARTLIVGRHAGLERYYWYAWDSSFLGLVVPDTNDLKPGAVAMGTLIRWMTRQKPSCTSDASRWVCQLAEEDGKQRFVAWSLPGRAAQFSAKPNGRVIAIERLDGARQEFAGSERPSEYPLNSEPLLFEVGEF